MSKGPLISIIIPTYQGERYIAGCLDSLSQQTRSHLEVVVVNDASTDATQSIIAGKAANDPRIRVITNPVNLNSYASRLKGAIQAKGTYLTFCDCDDRLPPNALRHLAQAAERTDADIIHGRSRELVNEEPGTGIPACDPFAVSTGTDFVLASLRNLRGWSVWGKLYRREIWNRVAPHFPAGAGWHMADDLLANFIVGVNSGKYLGIRDVVYHYRLPETHYFSRSDQAEKNIADHVEIIAAMLAYTREHNLPAVFAERVNYVARHILASIARNAVISPELSQSTMEKVNRLLGSRFTEWADEEGLSGRARSPISRARRWFRLAALPAKVLRRLLECGGRECLISARRALQVGRKRGYRSVLREIDSL